MSEMVMITAYIRPHQLEGVKTALADLGVSGVTVNDVRGCGASPERPRLFAGQEYKISMPARARLSVAALASLTEPIIAAIIEHARTGESGDGKIFVEPLAEAIRIRTQERGDSAV